MAQTDHRRIIFIFLFLRIGADSFLAATDGFQSLFYFSPYFSSSFSWKNKLQPHPVQSGGCVAMATVSCDRVHMGGREKKNRVGGLGVSDNFQTIIIDTDGATLP